MLGVQADRLALVVALAILGLLVGSFLNVVIARVPAGQSVVSPRSYCPACAAPIEPWDNVPVLSWLLLRGRARCCGARIRARYLVVELGSAAAFALVGVWTSGRAGTGWALPAFVYLAAISVALAAIDLDTCRLPFGIVAPSYPVGAALLGAASWAGRDGRSAVRMLIGAAAVWLLYRLLHQIYPAGMGYGDVRLSGVLGLYLGWLGWAQLVVGTFAGFVVGGVAGLFLVLAGRSKLKGAIPYGPYLLIGAWVGMLAGEQIGQLYLHAAGL